MGAVAVVVVNDWRKFPGMSEQAIYFLVGLCFGLVVGLTFGCLMIFAFERAAKLEILKLKLK